MSLYLFESQIASLKEAITAGLPGPTAHSKMAPAHRDRLISISRGPEYARKSGVLILLFPDEYEEINTVFIKRVEYEGVHSGQIAFPGGKFEDSDPDIIATAIREAEEEIGLKKESIQVVGRLSDLFVPPSNFIISPVIAQTPARPVFIPDMTEVAEIFAVPLRFFLNQDNSGEYKINYRNTPDISVPGFRYNNHLIWGATAMILSELLYIFGKVESRRDHT